jgi:hypothetical protein
MILRDYVRLNRENRLGVYFQPRNLPTNERNMNDFSSATKAILINLIFTKTPKPINISPQHNIC